MAEVRDAVAVRRLALGHDDAVHRAAQQAVRPVREQVADVDEDWGMGERGRVDGDTGPGAGGGQDFETRLRGLLEEERDAAVVAVGAGAYVGGGVIGAVWGDVGVLVRGG